MTDHVFFKLLWTGDEEMPSQLGNPPPCARPMPEDHPRTMCSETVNIGYASARQRKHAAFVGARAHNFECSTFQSYAVWKEGRYLNGTNRTVACERNFTVCYKCHRR